MSFFDILSAVSVGEDVNHPNSKAAKILKKMDSATLTILNGEALTYTNIGGRTGNTFGVNNNFQFDMEVFIEGLLHSDDPKWQKAGAIFGGIFLGPGSANNVTVGNRTVIDWMPKSVHNFTVIRGGKPVTFLYGNEKIKEEGMLVADTSTIFLVALVIFSAVIIGYDLVFNLGGQFNLNENGGGLMSPVGDPKYISTKQAEIAANEKKQEELKKISTQQAASGTILSPDALEKQQEDQEHLEHNHEELEESLQKAEKQKEWLIWSNIVIENRGIWVLKFLEFTEGSFMQVLREIEEAEKKIDIAKKDLATAIDSLSTKQQALSSSTNSTKKRAIKLEIKKLENLEIELQNKLKLAKNALSAAEDRLTFLKPPA